jgi:hypothetical protein
LAVYRVVSNVLVEADEYMVSRVSNVEVKVGNMRWLSHRRVPAHNISPHLFSWRHGRSFGVPVTGGHEWSIAVRMVRKTRTVLHLDGAVQKGLLLTAANQTG